MASAGVGLALRADRKAEPSQIVHIGREAEGRPAGEVVGAEPNDAGAIQPHQRFGPATTDEDDPHAVRESAAL